MLLARFGAQLSLWLGQGRICMGCGKWQLGGVRGAGREPGGGGG